MLRKFAVATCVLAVFGAHTTHAVQGKKKGKNSGKTTTTTTTTTTTSTSNGNGDAKNKEAEVTDGPRNDYQRVKVDNPTLATLDRDVGELFDRVYKLEPWKEYYDTFTERIADEKTNELVKSMTDKHDAEVREETKELIQSMTEEFKPFMQQSESETKELAKKVRELGNQLYNVQSCSQNGGKKQSSKQKQISDDNDSDNNDQITSKQFQQLSAMVNELSQELKSVKLQNDKLKEQNKDLMNKLQMMEKERTQEKHDKLSKLSQMCEDSVSKTQECHQSLVKSNQVLKQLEKKYEQQMKELNALLLTNNIESDTTQPSSLNTKTMELVNKAMEKVQMQQKQTQDKLDELKINEYTSNQIMERMQPLQSRMEQLEQSQFQSFVQSLADKVSDYTFVVETPVQSLIVSISHMAYALKDKLRISVTGGMIRDLALGRQPNDVDLQFELVNHPQSDDDDNDDSDSDREACEQAQRIIEEYLNSFYYSHHSGLRNHYTHQLYPIQDGSHHLLRFQFLVRTDPTGMHMDFTQRLSNGGKKTLKGMMPLLKQLPPSHDGSEQLSLSLSNNNNNNEKYRELKAFTIDHIELDLVDRKFSPDSAIGLRDLMKKQLRIHPEIGMQQWLDDIPAAAKKKGMKSSSPDGSLGVRLANALKSRLNPGLTMTNELKHQIHERMIDLFKSNRLIAMNGLCEVMCGLVNQTPQMNHNQGYKTCPLNDRGQFEDVKMRARVMEFEKAVGSLGILENEKLQSYCFTGLSYNPNDEQ